MNRRSFALGAISATILHYEKLYAAQQTVGNIQQAYVAQPKIVKQECPAWCWAASTSMIFAALGHQLDQMKVVERLYNSLECAPSGDTAHIVELLNAPWVDDQGVSFQANVVAAYDALHGINQISNATIVNELIANRPLFYCDTDHCMVIVDIEYLESPTGPIPQRVGVLDPLPTAPDYHPLTPAQMIAASIGGQMMLLAAVHI